MALAYTVIVFAVLMAFSSMIVDYGRAQLVKIQLQRTADAAARAAVSQIASGVAAAQNEAVSIAAANDADGSPVVIEPDQDIQFGTWTPATKTFSTLSGAGMAGANAIRVTCRRVQTRGTAVPLLFAQMIGEPYCDVSASSTAYISPQGASSGPGFVGLSSFNSSGIYTDSYNATTGSYASQTPGSSGSLISDSTIYAWSSNVQGDAHPGPGDVAQGGTFSGSTSPLKSAISYSTPMPPGSNNNGNISPVLSYSTGSFDGSNLSTWGKITLPGGTYVLSNLNCSAPIIFTGPTQLYISGQCNVNGSGYLGTYLNQPANLLIVCSGSLGLYPSQPIYADIFSPTASLSISPGSTSDFYGQIIVKNWAVYNYKLHFDTSLPSHNPAGGGFDGGGTGGSIALVQ